MPKGDQQMRTLCELDVQAEIVNEPMDESGLSNQSINDPDD